jgi:DNA-binding response OmpR family regulator
MKLLVVAQRKDLKDLITYHLNPIGFEILYYSDPVKVVDSIDEIQPDMLLFNAVDFPRHWKPVLKLLRERLSKEQAVFVVLAKNPPFEEAAKATYLGANGIIDANLPEKQQMQRLEELYRRYGSLKDKRRFQRLIPTRADNLKLVFSHPRTLAIITGSLVEISIKGASFFPDDASLTADLRRNDPLQHCTLSVDNEPISVSARVTRNEETIGLQFKSFETGGHHKLFHYIQNRSQRELQTAAHAAPPGEQE